MPNSSAPALAFYHSLPHGGARRVAYEHARRLRGKYDIAFYHIGQAEPETQDIRTVAVSTCFRPFQPSRLFRSPYGRLNSLIYVYDLLRLRGLSKEMAALLNRSSASKVLSHTCQYAQTPWLLQFIQKPVIYYCHEYNRTIHDQLPVQRPYQIEKGYRRMIDQVDPGKHLLRALLYRIEQQGLRAARQVLVNSSFMQQEIFRRYGIQTHVSRLGVDLEEYAELNLPRSNMLLSVGIISPMKGFDFIIDGLGKLPRAKRPRFVLVGFRETPYERQFLENLAREKDVDLTILTNVSQPELIRLYNQARFTVYTPHREPFGLVPLESMACGTPVVGIDEGGVRETVLDGQTGWLVPRSPEALAERVSMLLDNPALVDSMGKSARAFVAENWTWARSIDTLERQIQAVEGDR